MNFPPSSTPVIADEFNHISVIASASQWMFLVNSEKASIVDSTLTADREIDITRDVCPMTFVKTRIALDRLSAGQTLLVRLRGEEPLRNVPRTATEQGHTVLEQRAQEDGATLLLLRKSQQ
jgi:tRNA 2-thiouridine synthesizing protein A